MTDQTSKAPSERPTLERTFLFPELSRVRNQEGTVYIIKITPVECRIEAGNVPAYGYTEYWYSPNNLNGILWVLPQSEMEDGRFELVEEGSLAMEQTTNEMKPAGAAPALNDVLAGMRHRWWPAAWNNRNLRVWTMTLWDCSYTERSLTKRHGISVLITNHRRWWQPPICGVAVRY